MEDESGRFLIRPLRRTGGENRREDRPNMYFPITAPDGTQVYPIGPTGYESRWICNQEGYAYFELEGRIYWKKVNGKWQVYQKFYLQDKRKAVSNLWNDLEGNKKATRELQTILMNDDVKFDFPREFVDDKKDIDDIADLRDFCTPTALMRAANGNKGFAAAFSAKSTSSDRIIKAITADEDFQELLKYEEIILVAVNL